MGISLPGRSIELLSIVIATPLVLCKVIFLKVVKVVYFYRLVYVLILKAFGWAAVPLNLAWFVHGFAPLQGCGWFEGRPYEAADVRVVDDSGALGR
jgi:hypothetical protein